MRYLAIGLVAAISFIHGSAVRAEHEYHHDQHAHTHGLAKLTMAYVGGVLELSLASPAANLLGFEHRATTPQETEAIQRARAVLENPKQWLRFSGGACTPETVSVDLVSLEADASQDDVAHKEGHQAHDEEHAHAHEHHAGESDTEQRHSEVLANYRFSCERIRSATINLFEYFPGIEKVDAEWVTDTTQGATELRPAQMQIEF